MTKHLGRLVLAALFAAVAPRWLHAQSSGIVYAGQELDSAPQVSNVAATAKMIQDVYPKDLRRSGVSGTVQIQFIVGTNGKVEPGSAEIVAASVAQLGNVAKGVVEKIEFKPGMA